MNFKHNNKSVKIILCVIFIFSLSVHAGEDERLGGLRRVVIDPGHGGKDPGCHGSSTKEKEVTLAIGLKLGEFITEKYPEIDLIYTRKTDVFIELDERAQIANRNKADLFICIHANAGPEAAFGVETYVLGLHRTDAQRKIAERENSAIEFEDDGGKSYEVLSADAIIARQLQLSVFLDHSIMFASELQQEFVGIGRHDRGVRQAGFLVLYKTTMPSVLIETGFLTNKEEEDFLEKPENQVKMAQSMFKAFEDYKEYYDAADQSVYSGNEYNLDKFGIPEEEIAKEDVVYRVQIETSTNKIELDDPQFKNMPIWMYENNGLFKYTVGAFKDANSANDLKAEMRTEGYEHAFVVTFKGGVRVFL